MSKGRVLKKRRMVGSSSSSCPITLLMKDNFLEIGKYLSPVNVAALAFAYPPSNPGLKPYVKPPLELVEWSFCEKCESFEAHKTVIEFIDKLFPKLSTSSDYLSARWIGFVRALSTGVLDYNFIISMREWLGTLGIRPSPSIDEQHCISRAVLAMDQSGQAFRYLTVFHFLSQNEVLSRSFVMNVDHRALGALVGCQSIFRRLDVTQQRELLLRTFHNAVKTHNVAFIYHWSSEFDAAMSAAREFRDKVYRWMQNLFFYYQDITPDMIRNLLYSKSAYIVSRLCFHSELLLKILTMRNKLEALRALLSRQAPIILSGQSYTPNRIIFSNFQECYDAATSDEVKNFLKVARDDFNEYVKEVELNKGTSLICPRCSKQWH